MLSLTATRCGYRVKYTRTMVRPDPASQNSHHVQLCANLGLLFLSLKFPATESKSPEPASQEKKRTKMISVGGPHAAERIGICDNDSPWSACLCSVHKVNELSLCCIPNTASVMTWNHSVTKE